jgi:LemA protein
MLQKKRTGLLIIGVALLLFIVWVTSTYNTLISKQEVVKKQWAEVQSTYQRRVDLIPNLVNTVKGQADFEQTTLEKITEARSNALQGLTNQELSGENYSAQRKLQDNLAVATNRLIIQIERYPSLKGTKAFAGLQTQLEGTERRIRVARNDFNAAVADYNKKVRSFPANMVAGMFGFTKKEGFVSDAGSDMPVEIKF